MEEKKKKIKKSANSLSILTKILSVFLLVAGIIVTGVMFFTIAFKDNVIEFVNNHNENFSGNVSGFLNDSNFTIIVFFLLIIINLLFVSIITYIATTIFRGIKKDGIPFKIEYANKIKHIAVVLILYCLLPSSDINSTNSLNVEFSINVERIIIALTFLLLSRIFEYGCLLQKESDETL